jgi:septum formation inhibitor MinC
LSGGVGRNIISTDVSGAGKAEPFRVRCKHGASASSDPVSLNAIESDATKRARESAVEMAGTRGKRTAEASSQTRPDLPKPKRGAAAPAAPPLGVGEAPAAGSAPSPWPLHVHTRETMHLDVAHTLRSGRKVFFLNTDKPGPMQFRKG